MIAVKWPNGLGWDVGEPWQIEAGICATVARCYDSHLQCAGLIAAVPADDVVECTAGRTIRYPRHRAMRFPLWYDPIMAVMACNLDGELQYD